MKRHTTVRLSEKTDEQLKRLAELYGSQTSAIVVALDRLAREVRMGAMDDEMTLEQVFDVLDEERLVYLEDYIDELVVCLGVATEALKEVTAAPCCESPGCSVDDPMCDTMIARAAIDRLARKELPEDRETGDREAE